MKDSSASFARLTSCLLLGLAVGALSLSTVVYAQAGKAPATPPAPATQAAEPATPAPAVAPKATPGVVGDRNATVSDRVPPEQILSLQAGSETFPARYIADLSGQPLGAVIVLHASGQHPSWPFTVAALLDDLPLHGWSTLSIELPAPAQDATNPPANAAPTNTPTVAPANAANKTNTPAPAATPPATNNQTTVGIEPQAQARITAAVKYFTDQSQKPTRVVLLGFGSGATRAAEWTRQLVANQPPPPPPQKTEPISALILIAPANRLIGLEQDLPKILPSTQLPALDIILSSDPQALADAEARRRAVLHQRQRIYRRLELPPITGAESAQHSLMVRRVRAWLQRQATGEPEEYEDDRER